MTVFADLVGRWWRHCQRWTHDEAIAAARRFAEATGVDYATNLSAQGRERAAAGQVTVTFTEGDAEKLPFPDNFFDLSLSTVGVMFAPADDELIRVTTIRAVGRRIQVPLT